MHQWLEYGLKNQTSKERQSNMEINIKLDETYYISDNSYNTAILVKQLGINKNGKRVEKKRYFPDFGRAIVAWARETGKSGENVTSFQKAAEIFVRAYFHHGSAAFAAGGMAGRVFLEARGLFGVAERRVYAPEPADRAAYPVPRRRFGLQDRLDHPDPAAARDGRPAVPAVRRQAARAPDAAQAGRAARGNGGRAGAGRGGVRGAARGRRPCGGAQPVHYRYGRISGLYGFGREILSSGRGDVRRHAAGAGKRRAFHFFGILYHTARQNVGRHCGDPQAQGGPGRGRAPHMRRYGQPVPAAPGLCPRNGAQRRQDADVQPLYTGAFSGDEQPRPPQDHGRGRAHGVHGRR